MTELNRATVELAKDLNRGLAWARSLFGEMLQDPTTSRWHEEIELFLEDEGNQSEWEWVTEKPDY